MHKKLFFLLLGCLMILALLSACGSGQQAAGHPSGGSETSSPEQSLEEVHPGEDPAQTEVLDPETNDDAGGEEAVPAMPQPPSMSAGQSEESIHSANGTTSPDDEPITPPVQEIPSLHVHLHLCALLLAPSILPCRISGRWLRKFWRQVGASTFTATLEDNAAVDALVEMMENGPVTIQMSDYAGFEKVGALGASLPASNSQTTTQAGDIVLYQGNQIVLFYGSNSWSYTRLGKIDDLTGWAEALGSGDVSVTFSLGG